MDFKDAAARFRARQEPEAGAPAAENSYNFAESYRLRARMVGVLMRDARLNADRTLAECGRLLQVTAETVQTWEEGDVVPSLPQLELLAFYLGVPISHFWSIDTLEARHGRHTDIQAEYVAVRDRMIGAMLHQAREAKGLTRSEVAAAAAIGEDTLARYEIGEQAVPFHELTLLANAVDKNLSYFLESSGHIGELLTLREQWKHFLELPEDKREFAANPRNIGFIEIAILLSKMPTENLREVGASILDITR